MKNKEIIISSILIFFLNIVLVFPQCKDFHNSDDCFKEKGSKPRHFLQYSRNSTDLIVKDKPVALHLVANEHKLHHIIFCNKKENGNIHFKVMDQATGELIYDNQRNDYKKYFTFMPVKTRNLKIIVFPGAGKVSESCVGFILYKN